MRPSARARMDSRGSTHTNTFDEQAAAASPWRKMNSGESNLSAHKLMVKGLADMWAEGPGGGHYENMRGPYTQLGCGVFVNGVDITFVQDFR